MVSKLAVSVYFVCAMILVGTSSAQSSECRNILRTTCIFADQITSMHNFSVLSYMISKQNANFLLLF